MHRDYHMCECCGESKYVDFLEDCVKCGKTICTSCFMDDTINSNYAKDYAYIFDNKKPELMQLYTDKGFILYKDGSPVYKDGGRIFSVDSKYCPFCFEEEYTNKREENKMTKKAESKITIELTQYELENIQDILEVFCATADFSNEKLRTDFKNMCNKFHKKEN